MPCERSRSTVAATWSSSVARSPPSPQERILLEKNEKAPAVPHVPGGGPATSRGGRGGPPPRCQRAAVQHRGGGVGDVLDEGEAVAVAQRAELVDRGGVAGEVHRADGLRARADEGGDVPGVDPRVVLPADVGEHGGAA